jgi:hypothetical protein
MKVMYRTLLERAKPELKKAIAVNKVDYPATGEYLERHLSETIGVSFLPYGVVIDLENVARKAKLEFRTPWDLFEED